MTIGICISHTNSLENTRRRGETHNIQVQGPDRNPLYVPGREINK